MPAPLPVLLSIPHGGTLIPADVRDAFALSEYEWRIEDSDAYARELYDLKDRVAAVVTTEVVRAVVDVNRAPDDLPPANPDGAVKSHTCYGRPVYRNGAPPPAAVAERLLARWHESYHAKLRRLLSAPDAASRFRLALDCHTMAAMPPLIAPDRAASRPRPLVCLGNLHGATCPPDVLKSLADCLRDAWQLSPADIAMNAPFAGGYTLRRHGSGSPVPWVQVEMSRALYLESPWYDPTSGTIDEERLAWLRARFAKALDQYFCRL